MTKLPPTSQPVKVSLTMKCEASRWHTIVFWQTFCAQITTHHSPYIQFPKCINRRRRINNTFLDLFWFMKFRPAGTAPCSWLCLSLVKVRNKATGTDEKIAIVQGNCYSMLLFPGDKEMQFVSLQVEVKLLWWEQIYTANCKTTQRLEWTQCIVKCKQKFPTKYVTPHARRKKRNAITEMISAKVFADEMPTQYVILLHL